MPNLIELGAAAGAAALAVILGLAYWPHIENSATPGKSAVSQPVFVSAATATKSPPTPADAALAATAATAAPGAVVVVDDASARAKLAVALQASAAPPSAGAIATRSVTFASAAADAPVVGEAARRLCAQGLVAMAAGDIAGARLYLERAAENGDARALLALGETYDPATLARLGVLGVKGDAAKARTYYAKALAAGMGAARERMAAMEAQ